MCSISICFFISAVLLRVIVGIAGLIGAIVVTFFIPTLKG